MSTYKTEGIIIKRDNFGESSLLLHIYTRDYGKIEAVARSARKEKGKLKGHLEFFLLVELILARGRNIDTITSSLTAESFSSLRNCLEFLFGAYYILELVDKMTVEGHKDERIFSLLKKLLLFLDNLTTLLPPLSGQSGFPLLDNTIINKYNLSILIFQINLLYLSGFSPEFNKCVLCSKPIKSGENCFSFKLGGIVGKECAPKSTDAIPISDNAIKLLRLFQFKEGGLKEYVLHLSKCFKTLEKLKADKRLILDCVFLMNKFAEFNIERKIKGVDFIVFGQKSNFFV